MIRPEAKRVPLLTAFGCPVFRLQGSERQGGDIWALSWHVKHVMGVRLV